MKKSAVCIQSYARMWQAKLAYKLTLEQREKAAIMVQKCARKFLAQKKLQTLKENKRMVKENHAATIIQRFFQRLIVQIKTKQIIEDNAATNIQKCWRGYKNRKEFS